MSSILLGGAPPRNLFEGGPIVTRPAPPRRPKPAQGAEEASRALNALAREVAGDRDLTHADRHITSLALQSRARGVLCQSVLAEVIATSQELAGEWREREPVHKLAGYYQRAADIVAPLKGDP
jgi:hypothetical protein